MDFRFFVASLTKDEVNELNLILNQRINSEIELEASSPNYYLLEHEKTGNVIEAIKSVRNRFNTSLRLAKGIVEYHRARLNKS